MILDYEYKNGKLLLSYFNKKGNIEFKTYDWHSPLQWEICSDKDVSKSDQFKTWNKKPVKLNRSRYPNRYAIYEYLRKVNEEDQKDIFGYNKPNLWFCDIEVEITQGFPEAYLADNEVTSVSLINGDNVVLLGIKPLSDKQIEQMEIDMNKYFEKFDKHYKIKWIYCETEYELMDILFNVIIPKIPVMTGWNFIKYDWVYLVTRARKIGINPNVASPTGELKKPWSKNADDYKPIYEELPKHRMIFDYMEIFDKWDNSIKIRESMSLDFISSAVLDVKKLEYDGTLKDLYHNDWYTYSLYNCIDTALVQLIDEKQKTFDIMLSIANLAKIDVKSVLSQLRVTEGVLFDTYYENGIVMAKQKSSYTENDEDENDKKFTGGYVKFPCVGLKMWVVVFDYASLYPSTMRQFNIAPESYKGMKISDTECMLDGVKQPIDNTDIILLNGAVFKNEESGTKTVLTNIYFDRKSNKFIGLNFKKKQKLIENYKNQRKQLA